MSSSCFTQPRSKLCFHSRCLSTTSFLSRKIISSLISVAGKKYNPFLLLHNIYIILFFFFFFIPYKLSLLKFLVWHPSCLTRSASSVSICAFCRCCLSANREMVSLQMVMQAARSPSRFKKIVMMLAFLAGGAAATTTAAAAAAAAPE